MGIRKEVLVAYDLEDNKSRTKLFEKLKDLGLCPIQKSVMWGFLSQAEQSAVHRLFNEYLERKTDRAFLIRAELLNQRDNFVGVFPASLREECHHETL